MRRLLVVLVILAAIFGAFVLPGAIAARNEAKEHFREAELRIQIAIQDKKTIVDLRDLPHLRTIPDSIRNVAGLNYLYLSGTEVSSLDLVGQMADLETLYLSRTRVKDLTPLTQIPRLRLLDIGESRVQDLTPLANMDALERLDIGNTEILTLEPVTRMLRLRWINLHRSYARDGSRQYYDWLHQNVPEVYNGSAFRQNYTPAPLYLKKTWLNRVAENLYLPIPFPRP